MSTRERLADAVKRSLREMAGVRGLRPRQLHVFDDPNRDARGHRRRPFAAESGSGAAHLQQLTYGCKLPSCATRANSVGPCRYPERYDRHHG